MTKSSIYLKALEFVLKWEGGLTADEKTNKGITQSTYDTYRKTNNLFFQPVRQMTEAEMETIYHQIWVDSGALYLPGLLAVVHFDTAVQFGLLDATRLLQLSLKLRPTGTMNYLTIGKANSYTDDKTLAYNYCFERKMKRRVVIALKPHLAKYEKGWKRRDDALTKYVTKDLLKDPLFI